LRAITATLGLALAAGSMALAAPALADASGTKPAATTMPRTAQEQAAIKKKLDSVSDPAERRRLEAELKRESGSWEQSEKAAVLRKRLADTTDPDERKRLEAALAGQVSAVPVGAAETGLADVSGGGRLPLPTELPPALGGLALAGAVGVVVVRRRRLQPA
jgi:hypothetical protein